MFIIMISLTPNCDGFGNKICLDVQEKYVIRLGFRPSNLQVTLR